MTGVLVKLALIVMLLVVVLIKSVQVVRPETAAIVERLGKFRTMLEPGMHLVIPFVDSVRHTIDLREQVVEFKSQLAVTRDHLVLSVDPVVYLQVIDPVRATYEISSYLLAVEQLTMTVLRNSTGELELAAALARPSEMSVMVRSVLAEATGSWGLRIDRVELRAMKQIVRPEEISSGRVM